MEKTVTHSDYYAGQLQTLHTLQQVGIATDLDTLVRITDCTLHHWFHKIGVFNIVHHKTGEPVEFGVLRVALDPAQTVQNGAALDTLHTQIILNEIRSPRKDRL